MSGKPKRARSERRRQERALRGEVRARERLAAAAPGGAPDRPITVVSASVIEDRARATPCPQCGGELALDSHGATVAGGTPVRLVKLTCRLCHTPRQLWFRIEAPRAN